MSEEEKQNILNALLPFVKLALHYIPQSTQEIQRDKIEPVKELIARCEHD